jgi:DNA-binding transcriptional MerR regulator
MEQHLTVAEIARRTGLAVSHVRFYERAGLLPPPVRLGRQVRYPRGVLDRLATIAGAREAGLSLTEIRELSDLASRLADDRADHAGREQRRHDAHA